MSQTDLLFHVTAKKIGPAAEVRSRPKVFYVQPATLERVTADLRNGNAILFLNDHNKRKVEVYETPSEVLAMQALSQGATAAADFVKHYQNLAPTSSATAADQNVASKYYNEVNSVNGGTVRLPDPFVRRLVVINNFTTGSVNVLGRGTTSPISGTGAFSTAAYTIHAGERVTFLAPTAATAGTTVGWKVATDVGTV